MKTGIFLGLFCILLLSGHKFAEMNYPVTGLAKQDNTCLFTAPRFNADFELISYLTPVTVEDALSNKAGDWLLVKYRDDLFYTPPESIETDRKNFLTLSNYQAGIKDRTFFIRSLNTGLVFYKEPIRLPTQYMELYDDLKVFQKNDLNFLEVSVGGVDVTGFIYGLYDIKDRKWRLRFDNRANQNVLCYSPDRKYAVVDSGTAAGTRRLDVFNLASGKNEFGSDYETAIRPYWSLGKLYFYRRAGYFVKGLPVLDKNKQNIYARKSSFGQGKAETLEEYTNIFTE